MQIYPILILMWLMIIAGNTAPSSNRPATVTEVVLALTIVLGPFLVYGLVVWGHSLYRNYRERQYRLWLAQDKLAHPEDYTYTSKCNFDQMMAILDKAIEAQVAKQD
jgi:hypothetical protein